VEFFVLFYSSFLALSLANGGETVLGSKNTGKIRKQSNNTGVNSIGKGVTKTDTCDNWE
jgi:hypothetical protein